MGCDDKCTLFPDDIDGLLHGQTGFDVLGESEAYDLTIGCHDLVTDDDLYVIELLGVLLRHKTALHLVVVGDGDDVQASSPSIIYLCLGGNH